MPILDMGRWKGAVEALARILIGIAVHGILPSAYDLFAREASNPHAMSGLAPAGSGSMALAGPAPLAAITDAAQTSSLPSVGTSATSTRSEEVDATLSDKQAFLNKLRLEKDKARRKTLEFFRSKPLGDTYGLLMVLLCFERQVDVYGTINGKKWRNRQDAVVAETIRHGQTKVDAAKLKTSSA